MTAPRKACPTSIPSNIVNAARASFIIAILALFAAADGVRAKAVTPPPVQTADELIAHIRKGMAALDVGVKTGNFDQLRRLGTVAFAAAHPDDVLSKAFGPLKRTGVDLTTVATVTPVTPGPPSVDRDGNLRLNGLFQLDKSNISFDMSYAWTGEDYRLTAISVMPRNKPEQPVPFAPPATRE